MDRLLLLHAAQLASLPTFLQDACVAALSVDTKPMAQVYARRRELVCRRLTEMGLSFPKPEGAFYVFPCIKSTGLSSDEFCTRLIMEKHVAVVPGTAFGECGDGFVRVSYSYSLKHLKIALQRIREFIEELKNGN